MILELHSIDFADAETSHLQLDRTTQVYVVTDPSSLHRPQADIPNRVRQAVSAVLGEGVPTLSKIASELGLSARTLQRRLSASGQTYQSIVDAARRQLAHQLLRETDHCLAEIAFRTGFSEQSAFSRAFKRWSGQTPRSYRLDARFG
jgi:AraC-like DNA-binding protein